MKIKRKLGIFSVFFILGLFLFSTLNFSIVITSMNVPKENITIHGYDTYIEDFTTTTYKSGATNAFGWGTSTLSKRRNMTAQTLDFFPTADPVRSIDVQGRKAYFGIYNKSMGPPSMGVLDITRPDHLSAKGLSAAWPETTAVAINGDVFYTGQVTIGGYGLCIYNYSNSYSIIPPLMSFKATGQPITDIDVEGHLAYLAVYNSTTGQSFQIAYVEDPNNVKLIQQTSWLTPNVLGLEIDGHLGYMAASTEGFYVLNISNKHIPVEIGYVDTPGNATDVIIDGRFAYVADGSTGIHIIDIQDPLNPVIIGTYDTPGTAHKLVKQDSTLFVADKTGGVQILDVSIPAHPCYVTAITTYTVWDLGLFGEFLVVATDDGILTIKIGLMTNLGNSWYSNPFVGKEVWDVRVRDGIAYVAGGLDEFYVVNVRNPQNPQLIYNSSLGFRFNKLDINEQFAFLVNTFGIYIFDISDINNIHYVTYEWGLGLTDAHVQGEIVYVSYTNGVALLNISTLYPTNWISVTHTGITNATAIWAQGTKVYVTEWIGGTAFSLHLYDVSNFTNPQNTYSRNRFAYNYDVQVDGDFLNLAGNILGSGMWNYNVTDPYAVTINGNSVTNSYGVWQFGRYILSASYNEGVVLINASNPNVMFISSFYPRATRALQVSTRGDYTYVTNMSSLVILRHCKSTGSSFTKGLSIAESTEVDTLNVDGVIETATLTVEDNQRTGTDINYYMSADGGSHWELVTPNVEHIFTYQGNDLRWRAELAGSQDRSPYIYELSIEYQYNEAPTVPILNELGDTSLGRVQLDWEDSTDDNEVAYYQVQVSTSASFTELEKNITSTTSKKQFFGLPKGEHYFRVRAIDNEGLASGWSTTESIEVTFSLLSPLWLGIIGAAALILIAGIVVLIIFISKRKKKIPTR